MSYGGKRTAMSDERKYPNLMRNKYATHIDFRDFNGLIESNPRAVPSNLDMLFERKGYFLVGEWKRPNESISIGQQILLKALSRVPKFTVLVIIGSTEEITEVRTIFKVTNGGCRKLGEGLDCLKGLVSMWYDYANEH